MKVVFCMMLFLAGCASSRPEVGLGWGYNYQRIAPDTYSVHVRESRFASTAEAENLFVVASKKVIEANQCRSYRIKSYSPSLESAFLGASIPVIDGEIICLR